MEELPIQVEVHALVSLAVQRVAHERMVDVAHVDAYLVRAPGVEMALHQGVPLVAALGLEPVSYTHLDVYKRQALPMSSLAWIMMRLAMNLGSSPASIMRASQ